MTEVIKGLEDKQKLLVQKTIELTEERNKIAFGAHVENDPKSRKRLDAINLELATMASEQSSVDAALVEANNRLAIAQRDEALKADRANAEALRAKLNRFVELGLMLDDCVSDFVGAANEMNTVLNDIHALGCPSPNAAQMRVLGTIAVKSFVMQIPWTAKEWEHLPPNQRKTFANLVTGWRAMIEGNIASRLDEQKKEVA